MSSIRIALQNITKHRKDYFIAMTLIALATASLVFLQLLVAELKIGLHNAIKTSGFDTIVLNVAELKQNTYQMDYQAFKVIKDSLIKQLGNDFIITPILIEKVNLGRQPKDLFYRTNAAGVEAEFFLLRSFQLGDGNFFNDEEFKIGQDVVLISEDIHEKIFGHSNTFESRQVLYMKIDNKIYKLKVSGILKASMDPRYKKIFSNPVFTGIYLPLTFFKKSISLPMFFPHKMYTIQISDILIRSTDYRYYIKLRDAIIQRLKNSQIEFAESIYNFTNIKIQRMFDASTRLVNIFSGITIFAEIVVLTIVMVMVVQSRYREITIRKIEGATRKKIVTMFLGESMGVAGIGGLLGIVMGYLLKEVLFRISSEPLSRHDALVVLVGLSLSVLVGVLASIIPAIEAWRVEPVNGLKTPSR